MFRAGQESVLAGTQRGQASDWRWPLLTAALALLSAGLGWRLLNSAPHAVERADIRTERPALAVQVDRSQETEDQSTQPSATADLETRALASGMSGGADRTRLATCRDDYLTQRRLALTVGLDALTNPLPTVNAKRDEGVGYREMRKGLFDL